MDRDFGKRRGLSTVNALAGSPVAQEKAAIYSILSELEYMLDTAHSNIGSLEEKLASVSEQIPETEMALDAAEQIGSSPLYTRLHQAVQITQHLNQRVVRARNRLEV